MNQESSQRKQTEGNEHDAAQGRLIPRLIQPLIQRKLKPAFGPGTLSGKKSSPDSSTSSKLPSEVQAKMEGSFGEDFSDVKIHDNSTKAEELGAKAFAQGKDLHFAPGEFEPTSKEGQELIGHELTHVVQQKEGKVQGGDVHGKDMVNQDPSLEKEADDAGKLASEGKGVEVKGNGWGLQRKVEMVESNEVDWATTEALLRSRIASWVVSLQDAITYFYTKIGIEEDEKFTAKDAGSLVFNWFGIGDQYEATMTTIAIFNDLTKLVPETDGNATLGVFVHNVKFALDQGFNPNFDGSKSNLKMVFNSFKRDCTSKGYTNKASVNSAVDVFMGTLLKPQELEKNLTLNWIKSAKDGDNGMDWDDDAGMIKVRLLHLDNYGSADDNIWELKWAYLEDVPKQGGVLSALRDFFGSSTPIEQLKLPIWYELDTQGESKDDPFGAHKSKYLEIPTEEREFTVVFNGVKLLTQALKPNQKVMLNDWLKSKMRTITIGDLTED